jgi:hypothetical protein
MKTHILRYSPPSDDGHPAILVVLTVGGVEAVFEGEDAELMKAQIEWQEAGRPA